MIAQECNVLHVGKNLIHTSTREIISITCTDVVRMGWNSQVEWIHLWKLSLLGWQSKLLELYCRRIVQRCPSWNTMREKSLKISWKAWEGDWTIHWSSNRGPNRADTATNYRNSQELLNFHKSLQMGSNESKCSNRNAEGSLLWCNAIKSEKERGGQELVL